MKMKSEIEVQIRWLLKTDMPEVLEIERACFKFPWTEEDFSSCLVEKNYIGLVTEYDDKMVGVMIYEINKTKLRIINFAVDPVQQRRGIGRQMIRHLVEKLSQQRRSEIVLEVHDSNLAAQMFFKKQEFRAVRVLRNYYTHVLGDAYVMRYRLSNSGGDE